MGWECVALHTQQIVIPEVYLIFSQISMVVGEYSDAHTLHHLLYGMDGDDKSLSIKQRATLTLATKYRRMASATKLCISRDICKNTRNLETLLKISLPSKSHNLQVQR